MKLVGILLLTILLSSTGFLFGRYSMEKIDGMLPSYGAETGGNIRNSPPPIDSICLVFAGVDYGDAFSAPTNYVNARHTVNVRVGSYYFPVVTWETGASWGGQSLFSYWDDMFEFWSYPDSFTSNNGVDTGRPSVVTDSKGNLYFVWHQDEGGQKYETRFTRAFLDTSTGFIAYSVERPAILISTLAGAEETFPVMAISGDTLIMVVWMVGGLQADYAMGYNYSTDAGTTWAGPGILNNHGSKYPANWILQSLAPDPTSGDMWMAVSWDSTGDAQADIVAYHWDASSNTWSGEVAAAAPTVHPYAIPAVVVDYNGVPYIVFQENLSTDGGVNDVLSGYNASGPAGTLYYTHRVGGTWSTPGKVMFPGVYEVNNYAAGWPSAGITTDNVMYFSTTQPDTSTLDTSVYLPFNVHYASYNPYLDTMVYGGKVSGLTLEDSITSAIYAHITYDIPIGSEVDAGTQGPGIEWSQLIEATTPADVYYVHKDTLILGSGVEEAKPIVNASPVKLWQNYPNPSKGKTMIRFTVPSNTDISLSIYDISGRLIKTLAKGIPGAGSYFVVWNGKDMNDNVIPAGIYLYTLKAGSYTETKKIVRID